MPLTHWSGGVPCHMRKEVKAQTTHTSTIAASMRWHWFGPLFKSLAKLDSFEAPTERNKGRFLRHFLGKLHESAMRIFGHKPNPRRSTRFAQEVACMERSSFRNFGNNSMWLVSPAAQQVFCWLKHALSPHKSKVKNQTK